ncbi:hypothetical protein BpHYR1_047103 [Brachionus plicatilis]|uniref:Uncharacterized protein n=1 Tax=Brachionus plicatilis TaxID=10195 RepID=A0A3M7Q0Y6_BRAPC|nr:hypothetical protein BpHYR1_047103 [Brachionus plicatilis]
MSKKKNFLLPNSINKLNYWTKEEIVHLEKYQNTFSDFRKEFMTCGLNIDGNQSSKQTKQSELYFIYLFLFQLFDVVIVLKFEASFYNDLQKIINISKNT